MARNVQFYRKTFSFKSGSLDARAFKCFELILGKMYTIITNFSVKLTEKVVPDTDLLYKKVEKNTICQLKRWLKCRKQPIKRKKQQLVDQYVV